MVSSTGSGVSYNGRELHVISISAGSACVKLCNLGATLLSLQLPATPAGDDPAAALVDVVLGFDQLEGYFKNPACYGAIIGPSANRSDLGRITVADKTYQLPQNDGPKQQNNLHTDLDAGLHKCVWDFEADPAGDSVTFSYDAADGQWGLPGARHFSVRYELAENPSPNAGTPTHSLRLSMRATTTAPTFVNLTSHSYFNLGGIGSGNVLNTLVRIPASAYLPLREDSVSEGVVAPVANTPFDFRSAKPLGQDIATAHEQLKLARGYDHCMVVDGYEPGAKPRLALSAQDPTTGRTLDIYISTPGAHLYTGNWLDDKNAKAGISFGPRDGFAFEPEFFPNCTQVAGWEVPVCTPDKPYEQEILYHFGFRPTHV